MDLLEISDPVLTETLAVVSSDGTVLLIPDVIAQSSCSVDITHFPFDEQTCMLKVKIRSFIIIQLIDTCESFPNYMK